LFVENVFTYSMAAKPRRSSAGGEMKTNAYRILVGKLHVKNVRERPGREGE
jgi:hypothetical protein